MRPRERRDGGQNDLFKARLDQIVDINHLLAKLGRTVDWGFLETSFGAVYSDGPGQPPLPTRLRAGIAILKHMHDLSDEVLCERWIENPYYQRFCGEGSFQHKLPFDRSSMTRWRPRMGEAIIEDAEDLSRPRHPRHCAQDQGQLRRRSRWPRRRNRRTSPETRS